MPRLALLRHGLVILPTLLASTACCWLVARAPAPAPPAAAVADQQPKGDGAQQQAQPPALAAGDELGDPILPADKAPADAPLRPMKGLTLYKLSNLRIGNPGPGPAPRLMVHYERITGEEQGIGPTLVIRTSDGNERTTIGGFGPGQGRNKAGDFVVNLGFQGGPPKNVEVYLVHLERRWEDEGFRPKFKISNSVVLGDMGRPLQLARDWTAQETAKLGNPPPDAPQMNANNNVGEDTEFIGNTMGLLPAMRYADPNKRAVIGVLYRTGEGEADKGVKVKCLVHLTPAYDTRQPRYGQEAVFAKAGYAVGGLQVKTKKIVTAVKAVFMKQQADGRLDPTDKYESKWLGSPDEADKEGTVQSDGRKVIGMHLKHFGVVNAVALVLDR
jgi:hypothetical protein